MVEKYLDYQQDRVDGGFITKGRWLKDVRNNELYSFNNVSSLSR